MNLLKLTFKLLPAILVAAAAMASGEVAAQTPAIPRTAWGDPDIQGLWTNHTLAPFERPVELGDKEFLTEQEVADMQRRIDAGASVSIHQNSDNRRLEEAPAATLAAGQPVQSRECTFAACWEKGHATRRTSIIVDPKNGRLPPLTPAGEKRSADRRLGAGTDITDIAIAKGYQVNGPEDLGSWVRCISRSLPDSMVPANYGGVYQILQTPGYFVILLEMIHETRTIPLDGRPHIAPNIRHWMGDPRGRWEGNTLVVETTNFEPRTTFRGTGPNMRLIERYTVTGPETIDYTFTVIDPENFTQPWTAFFPMAKERTSANRLMEYACHEGNYAPEIFLQSARQREQDLAAGKK